MLVAVGAYAFFGRGGGKPPQAPAGAAAGPAPAVTVVRVESADIRSSTTFTGRVQAIDKVDLRARVPGYLEKQLFQDGAQVESGQLMFVIEQPPYQAEVAKIQADLQGAQADLLNAKAELSRQEQLVSKGYSTPAKLDEAKSKFGLAQGTVDKDQAALEQAKLNLSYTEVRSPVAGRVGQRAYSVGNYVQPSSGTLATVVSRDPMYVMFPVTQRELIDIRRKAEAEGVDGRAVTVRLQLADGQMYDQTGAVDFVDVTVNQATDSVNVRAKFPNPKGWLIDGQLVTAVVESTAPRKALLIPQQALQFDQTGYFVLVVDADNKVKVQPIGIGSGHDTDLEVISGLNEGDRVITEGVQKVRPEQVVNPTEKPKAAAQAQ
ncbi:MAG TPA: efflux RND transporter periplasmic adaptor subunit [Alphaproteobacteria bacterium]|nr:efflux RND transporter periplasmic adaptor subunit [Alphaproteobacteria bacterium]